MTFALLSCLAYVLFSVAHTIIVSSPNECGGTRIVTHGHALFGPAAESANVRGVSLFVPRPQANGVYLRSTASVHHSTVRKTPPHPSRLSSLLLSLFGMRISKGTSSGFANAAIISHDIIVESASVPQTTLKSSSSSPRSHAVIPPSLSLPLPASVSSFTLPPSLRWLTDFRLMRQHTPLYTKPPARISLPSIIGPLERTVKDKSSSSTTEAIVGQGAVEPGTQEKGSNKNSMALFDACTPLSVPTDLRNIRGKVAVVGRGFCEFVTKVSYMQAAGAVAVIVVTPDNKLAAMTVNRSEEAHQPTISIPSVMITYDTWSKIAPCAENTTVVFTSQGDTIYNGDSSRDALNWAMMRGMALWILCQCGVNVVRYKRRVSEYRARAEAIAALPLETYNRRGSRRESPGPSQDFRDLDVGEAHSSSYAPPSSNIPIIDPPGDRNDERVGLIGGEGSSNVVPHPGLQPSGHTGGLSQPPLAGSSSTSGQASEQYVPMSASVSAPIRVEEEFDSDDDDGACAICLEEFETGQEVRLLACSHIYHRHCIDPWLQSSSNCCPLCKREVPNLPPPPSQLHYGSMVV